MRKGFLTTTSYKKTLDKEEEQKKKEPPVPPICAEAPSRPRLGGPLSARRERDLRICLEKLEGQGSSSQPTSAVASLAPSPAPSPTQSAAPSMVGDLDSLVVSDDERSDISYTSTRSKMPLKRKQGRPPTTGEYIGLLEAKRALNEAAQKELELLVEKEVLTAKDLSPRQTRARGKLPPVEDLVQEWGEETEGELADRVEHSLKRANHIVDVSKNLKGTFVNELRREFLAIKATFNIMRRRITVPQDSEVGRLREANCRLKEQVDTLRGEIAAVRRELVEHAERVARRSPPPPRSPPSSRSGPTEILGPVVQTSSCPEIDAVASMDKGNMPPPIQRQAPRSKGKRGGRLGQPTERGSEEEMMCRIGELIDARLGQFAARFLGDKNSGDPGRATPRSSSKQGHKARKTAPASKETVKGLTPMTDDEPWSKVVGRKAKRRRQSAAQRRSAEPEPTNKEAETDKGKRKKPPSKRKARRPRPPKTAAVVVSIPVEEREKTTLNQVMTKAKAGINLADVGIVDLGVRRSFTGDLILQVSGEDMSGKADRLAAEMRKVLKGSGAQIARPTKRAEMRVRGLDDSATREEVASAIAAIGGCAREDIRVGTINRPQRGMGTIWAQCPAEAAASVAKAGKITVGWIRAPVEILRARPAACYRCLEPGHARAQCGGPDRGARCYRCGQEGHKAPTCTGELCCPLCRDLNRPTSHRLGSAGCAPSSLFRRRRGKDTGEGASAPPPRDTGAAPPLKRREGKAAERAQLQEGRRGGREEDMDTT